MSTCKVCMPYTREWERDKIPNCKKCSDKIVSICTKRHTKGLWLICEAPDTNDIKAFENRPFYEQLALFPLMRIALLPDGSLKKGRTKIPVF